MQWAGAVYAYEGVARELIARVKYRNERVAVRWLGARLAAHVRVAARGVDVVTWVPASAQRLRDRGVDHGALLARSVGAALGVPAIDLLARGAGPPQTGRPARERCTGPALRARERVAGRRVLVVDDVVTTGATMRSAARALGHGGARTVLAAAVARTPSPTERTTRGAYTRRAGPASTLHA